MDDTELGVYVAFFCEREDLEALMPAIGDMLTGALVHSPKLVIIKTHSIHFHSYHSDAVYSRSVIKYLTLKHPN